jgi:peptidoglycan lytic transglycosylase
MSTAATERRSSQRPRALLAALLVACALGPLALASPVDAASGGAAPIVSSEAGAGLAFSPWHLAGVTWYGPGLYGRHTACGQTLRRATLGVAHRSLPCGTAVKFFFHGRRIVTTVIDRGPFSKGNSWDLTSASARALGFSRTGRARIRYAVELNYARH